MEPWCYFRKVAKHKLGFGCKQGMDCSFGDVRNQPMAGCETVATSSLASAISERRAAGWENNSD